MARRTWTWTLFSTVYQPKSSAGLDWASESPAASMDRARVISGVPYGRGTRIDWRILFPHSEMRKAVLTGIRVQGDYRSYCAAQEMLRTRTSWNAGCFHASAS